MNRTQHLTVSAEAQSRGSSNRTRGALKITIEDHLRSSRHWSRAKLFYIPSTGLRSCLLFLNLTSECIGILR